MICDASVSATDVKCKCGLMFSEKRSTREWSENYW